MNNILRVIICILGMHVTSLAWAKPAYLDLTYENTEFVLPGKNNWFERLLKDEQNEVYLVVSVTKKNGARNKEVLLIAPHVVESFKRTNGKLERSKSENLGLLTDEFTSSSDQLRLKVEFYSVSKSKASAFTESIKSLSLAYATAGATPAASQLITSALNTVQTVLLDNQDVYLSYTVGLPASKGESSLRFYVDSEGRIDESPSKKVDVSANIAFSLKSKYQFGVDFGYGFENQSVNDKELDAYTLLTKARSPSDKRDACRALKRTLNKRFSKSTTDDLVAIAVNDIQWYQDETEYYCIEPDKAVNYKNIHKLTDIANCTSEECIKTKFALLLSKGRNVSSDTYKSTLGVDLNTLDCKTTTAFTRLSNWSTIITELSSPDIKSYSAKSCLETENGTHWYKHTFSWNRGVLQAHTCDLQTQQNSCS